MSGQEGAIEALTDAIANAMAQARTPPSTVYMDGSHNPRPSELREARFIAEHHLTELQNLLDRKESAIRTALDFVRYHPAVNGEWPLLVQVLESALGGAPKPEPCRNCGDNLDDHTHDTAIICYEEWTPT